MSESSFCVWSNAATWVPAAVDVKSWYSTLHGAAAVDCWMWPSTTMSTMLMMMIQAEMAKTELPAAHSQNSSTLNIQSIYRYELRM